jgi:hypothetical protein
MAGNITAASIKYSTPLVAKVGDLLFTATQIETSGTLEEYVEGGVELLESKLGLTDEAISGAFSVAREATVGETASTTALPALIWCNPFLVKAKESNEAQKEIASGFPCQVTVVKGVPYLRVFALAAAGQEKPIIEVKVKTVISLCTTTIFALGK